MENDSKYFDDKGNVVLSIKTILATITVFGLALSVCALLLFLTAYKLHTGQFYKEVVVTDTVYISVPTIVYKDTCDSKFMKAIIETETRNYTKLAKGYNIYPSISENGKYIGFFQMGETYFGSCRLADALNYVYEDMFDPQRSFHVFWAKMGVYADRLTDEYKMKGSKEPISKQDLINIYCKLARIHAGGYSNKDNSTADKYANYFLKTFNR